MSNIDFLGGRLLCRCLWCYLPALVGADRVERVRCLFCLSYARARGPDVDPQHVAHRPRRARAQVRRGRRLVETRCKTPFFLVCGCGLWLYSLCLPKECCRFSTNLCACAHRAFSPSCDLTISCVLWRHSPPQTRHTGWPHRLSDAAVGDSIGGEQQAQNARDGTHVACEVSFVRPPSFGSLGWVLVYIQPCVRRHLRHLCCRGLCIICRHTYGEAKAVQGSNRIGYVTHLNQETGCRVRNASIRANVENESSTRSAPQRPPPLAVGNTCLEPCTPHAFTTRLGSCGHSFAETYDSPLLRCCFRDHSGACGHLRVLEITSCGIASWSQVKQAESMFTE